MISSLRTLPTITSVVDIDVARRCADDELPFGVPICPHLYARPLGDARLAELRVLWWAEHHGELQVGQNLPISGRDLLLALVGTDCLTAFSYERSKNFFSSIGQGTSRAMGGQGGLPGESRLERALMTAKVDALDRLYQDGGGVLHLTHHGRVRLSELKQALRADRERDAFGILLDGRYAEQDLVIAILDAGVETPLSVVFMDMNGLKHLNDTYGHDAGDAGLRAYFQAVSAAFGESGQAYRLGGDEVLAILPTVEVAHAAQLVGLACRRLMSERIPAGPEAISLSVAAGIVVVTDPLADHREVRKAADRVQYAAKAESRQGSPRPSVIAIEGADQPIIITETTEYSS